MVRANMDVVRKNIRRFMSESSIDQKELSRRAKISYDPFNKFMNGSRTGIGLNTLLSVAEALQVHPSSLLDETRNLPAELEFIYGRLQKMSEVDQIRILKALKLMVEVLDGNPEKTSVSDF